uniref:Uncharacterized protein n=1 Tax=Naja naja TaxID=35670 RepID=A0A8C7E4D2_NAJNA
SPHLCLPARSLKMPFALSCRPLHIAVAQGNLLAAQHLVILFNHGQQDLDIFNNLRQTPLHLAVIIAQPSLVKLLLSHGASPMVLDRHGQSALHLACEHSSLRCLQELLKGNLVTLDLEARNFEGDGRSPLLHAVENNNLDMVELLLQHGANVNAQSYGGNTALHTASGRGLLDMLRLLVRNGADGSLKNYHNDTALMVGLCGGSGRVKNGPAGGPRRLETDPIFGLQRASTTGEVTFTLPEAPERGEGKNSPPPWCWRPTRPRPPWPRPPSNWAENLLLKFLKLTPGRDRRRPLVELLAKGKYYPRNVDKGIKRDAKQLLSLRDKGQEAESGVYKGRDVIQVDWLNRFLRVNNRRIREVHLWCKCNGAVIGDSPPQMVIRVHYRT